MPDFIVRIKAPERVIARNDSDKVISKGEIPRSARNNNPEETAYRTLNLIIEVTGEKLKDKEVKVGTAKDLWVPAVNNHGGFGEWAFLEITDPWNAQNEIREFLKGIS